jgi:hypothetical protein
LVEPIIYLAVLTIAAGFSFNNRVVGDERSFYAFTFGVYLIFSVVIRMSGLDDDIATYVQSFGSTNLEPYYLREPLVWVGLRFINLIARQPVLTMVIADVLVLTLMAAALRNLKAPQYAYFAILLFFPMVLGMQNVYRQWVAAAFVIYAISVVGKSNAQVIIACILAALSHNVAIIFWAVPAIMTGGLIGGVAAASSLVLSPLSIVLGADSKSEAATGADMALIYPLALIVIGVLVMLFKPRLADSKIWIGASYVFGIWTSLCAATFLPSATAERFAIFSLAIFFPLIIAGFETQGSDGPLRRMAISVLGFVPVLVFSTRGMILPI